MFITKKTTTLILALTVLCANFLFSNSLSLEDNGDSTWNVNYSSDGAIGGFQFNVDGASVLSASGGDSAANGFMVSTSSTMALGFSLTGATIPAGEGTLLVLSLDGAPTGLSGIVVSDASGSDLGFEFDNGEEPTPTISILSPMDGDEVEGNDIDVSVSCTDCDGYHYHTYIDGAQTTPYMHFSNNFTLTDVSFGSHILDVVLADASHTDSDILASVSFTNIDSATDGGDDGGEGVIGDESNSLWLIDNGDNWSIGFNNDDPIGGFQLNIDGASINSATGGAATDAGFMISANATTILGFSLSGATIPSQNAGVLIDLDLSGIPTGISGIVVSDATGNDLGFTYDDGSVTVYCDDMEACNYDEEGDCVYPEENYDCDGNCIEFDDCGVCGGDGPEFECWDGSFGCNATDCPEEPADLIELSFQNVNTTDGTLDVYMTNSGPVAGFQVEISGLNITGASGGSATDAGFMISTGASTLLGFSLSGATIPAGEALLLSVSFARK